MPRHEPGMPRRLARRLGALFARRRVDDDLDAEIRTHLTLLEAEHRRRGLSPRAAREAARRDFGGVEQVKEQWRDARGLRWFDDLRRDVTFALRGLRRNPGFTAVAVLTLALGIGAAAGIVSVVNIVLVRPLPYADSDRLVRLIVHVPAAESPNGRDMRVAGGIFDASDARAIAVEARTVARAGLLTPALMSLSGREEAARLQGWRVSAAIVSTLGRPPALGRLFGARDEAAGAEDVLLLSHRAWVRHFGADADVIGQRYTLEGVLGPRVRTGFTVIGVMPDDFWFPDSQADFWIPMPEGNMGRGTLLARLADGVSPAAAAAEIETFIRERKSHTAGVRYEFVRERDELVAPVRRGLVVLAAAVGLVLLIACVNVANMLLARANARQRDTAIRGALGAGRGRLIRQSLTESLVLSLVAGIAGAVLACGGIELLRHLAATIPRFDLGVSLFFPRLDEVGVDGSMLLLTLIISTLSAVLLGLPAVPWRLPASLARTLQGGGAGSRRARMAPATIRAALVTMQVALATTLLIGGMLLGRSFVELVRVDPGYEAANVLTFQVALPADRYPGPRLIEFAETLSERLRGAPGVRAAAYANQLPMVQLRDSAGGLWRTSDPERGTAPDAADARLVSRAWFEAMGIRVVAGRGFSERDTAGSPRAMVVNEALARRDLAGDAIGQHVYVGRDPLPWEIVGVVEDVRQFGLGQAPEPQFFIDLRQWTGGGLLFPVGAYFVVRTGGDPMAIVPPLRALVAELDGAGTLFNVVPMERLVASTTARQRMYAVLLGLFAAIGAGIAAIGIYGVIAYAVAQRTREIGIRIALGAGRAPIMAMVLRQTAALTVLGVAVGLSGAAALARRLDTLMFGVAPLDPATFVAVPALFACIAAIAAAVPARRAARVDPQVAIRCD
jgi:predicted permease